MHIEEGEVLISRRRGLASATKRVGLLAVLAFTALSLLGQPPSATAADDPYCTIHPEDSVCIKAFVANLIATAGSNAPPGPVNVTPPTVTGTARDGEYLTGSVGTWTNDPKAFLVGWQRCRDGACASINSATDQYGYRVQTEDIGYTIQFVVRAANAGGYSNVVSSSPTATVEPGPPYSTQDILIAGVPTSGQTLTMTYAGNFKGVGPLSYAYQWQRCEPGPNAETYIGFPDNFVTDCQNIAGATGSSYTLTDADVESSIRLLVTASNPYGSGSRASGGTQVVSATPPAEPEAGEPIDTSTARDAGTWFGLAPLAAQGVNSGALSMVAGYQLSVAAGRPPVTCRARILHKVGGLYNPAGPQLKARNIYWGGFQTCRGGQQVAYMFGYSFLDRLNGNVFSLWDVGSDYTEVREAIFTGGQKIEFGTRRSKRMQWQANTELPAPYQWAQSRPIGLQAGVDRARTTCRRYSLGGVPAYLGGLDCRIYSNRFR